MRSSQQWRSWLVRHGPSASTVAITVDIDEFGNLPGGDPGLTPDAIKAEALKFGLVCHDLRRLDARRIVLSFKSQYDE